MKFLSGVVLLIILMTTAVQTAEAQTAFRIGGGVILDGTQPGGGVALDFPLLSKPYGLLLSADYYSKSGATSALLRGTGMYDIPMTRAFKFYVGAGTGIFYKKETILGFDRSTTKPLITGVAGMRYKTDGSMGFYAETGFDRALTSGATNLISLRLGFSFGGR